MCAAINCIALFCFVWLLKILPLTVASILADTAKLFHQMSLVKQSDGQHPLLQLSSLSKFFHDPRSHDPRRQSNLM